MNGAGDKMVTNGKADSNGRSRKGGKAGPAAIVKFGSASVPIYLSESKGRKRYLIAHYRDGKRIRKAFPDLAAAKKEALFVAQRIQCGMQHVTDLKPHERDNLPRRPKLLTNPAPAGRRRGGLPPGPRAGGSESLAAMAAEYRKHFKTSPGASRCPRWSRNCSNAREQDGASKRYLSQLRTMLNRFAAARSLARFSTSPRRTSTPGCAG